MIALFPNDVPSPKSSTPFEDPIMATTYSTPRYKKMYGHLKEQPPLIKPTFFFLLPNFLTQ